MATSYSYSARSTQLQNANTDVNQPLSIYVGNLSFNTTEEDLKAFFDEKCGNVKRVHIVYDNNTGQSRGFGFVNFTDVRTLNYALKLNQIRLDGRELRISPARNKQSSIPSNSSTNTPETHASTDTTTGSQSQAINRHKTQVVHCKKSGYDVYIGRPSDWGNPFVIGRDGDRVDVIRKYRSWIIRQPDLLARIKPELRGRRIACWCKPEACHGDVLAELADTD